MQAIKQHLLLERNNYSKSDSLRILDTNSALSGVDKLDPILTINGSSVAPMFRYKGGDATTSSWPHWGYGSVIPIAGSGDDVLVNQGSPLLGSSDDSSQGGGGKYFQMASATTYDFTTEDFNLEVVVKKGTTTSGRILDKRGASGAGYYLTEENGSDQITLYIEDGSANSASINSPTLVDGAWYKLSFYMDRSGSGICYANAEAGSAVDISSVGTLTNTDKFTVFADSDGNNDSSTTKIALLTMWKKAAWLDTHLQATVAKDRFLRMCGMYPQIARGTSIPTSFTRASSAYLEKNGTFYQVGAGWPRMEHVTDTNGASFKGYHTESEETNEMLQSCTLDTGWTKRGTAAVTENSTDSIDPVGLNQASKLSGIGTGANDFYYHMGNGTYTNATALAAGVWIKRISTAGVVHFGNSIDSTGVLGKWNIDLATLGTGWVRITRENIETYGSVVGNEWISNATGNSGLQIFKVSGTGTLSFYIWNCMLVENGSTQVGSDTPITVAAATTREPDSLYYKGDDGNAGDQRGTILCDVLHRDFTPGAVSNLVTLSDGGSANDCINVRLNTSSQLELYSKAATVEQVDESGSTDICDNDNHLVKVRYKPNSVWASLAGTQETTEDSDCTIPNDLDRIHIGCDEAGINQLNGWIKNVRLKVVSE